MWWKIFSISQSLEKTTTVGDRVSKPPRYQDNWLFKSQILKINEKSMNIMIFRVFSNLCPPPTLATGPEWIFCSIQIVYWDSLDNFPAGFGRRASLTTLKKFPAAPQSRYLRNGRILLVSIENQCKTPYFLRRRPFRKYQLWGAAEKFLRVVRDALRPNPAGKLSKESQ